MFPGILGTFPTNISQTEYKNEQILGNIAIFAHTDFEKKRIPGSVIRTIYE